MLSSDKTFCHIHHHDKSYSSSRPDPAIFCRKISSNRWLCSLVKWFFQSPTCSGWQKWRQEDKIVQVCDWWKELNLLSLKQLPLSDHDGTELLRNWMFWVLCPFQRQLLTCSRLVANWILSSYQLLQHLLLVQVIQNQGHAAMHWYYNVKQYSLTVLGGSCVKSIHNVGLLPAYLGRAMAKLEESYWHPRTMVHPSLVPTSQEEWSVKVMMGHWTTKNMQPAWSSGVTEIFSMPAWSLKIHKLWQEKKYANLQHLQLPCA